MQKICASVFRPREGGDFESKLIIQKSESLKNVSTKPYINFPEVLLSFI
jgi:hypothetical protein